MDGSGSDPKREVVLEIQGGIIAAVGESSGTEIPTADLSEWSLMPAFFDSHVHLSLSGTWDRVARREQLDASYERVAPFILERVMKYLSLGIIGVRDGGDHQGHCMRFRLEELEERAPGFIIRSAGKAWHRQGRYGGFLGRSLGADVLLVKAVSSSTEPFDHIKIINSGVVSLKEYGACGRAQFDKEELGSLVHYARRRGLKTMVHANGSEAVRIAVEAGCDSIEHGFFMCVDKLKRMADKRVYWVHNLYAMAALGRCCAPEEASVAHRTLQAQMEQVAIGADMGVPIAMGTDAGSMGVTHGTALGEEIRLFLECGMTPQRIVKFASLNGAAVLGIDSDRGSLCEGRRANIVAIKGSPRKAMEEFSTAQRLLFGPSFGPLGEGASHDPISARLLR